MFFLFLVIAHHLPLFSPFFWGLFHYAEGLMFHLPVDLLVSSSYLLSTGYTLPVLVELLNGVSFFMFHSSLPVLFFSPASDLYSPDLLGNLLFFFGLPLFINFVYWGVVYFFGWSFGPCGDSAILADPVWGLSWSSTQDFGLALTAEVFAAAIQLPFPEEVCNCLLCEVAIDLFLMFSSY